MPLARFSGDVSPFSLYTRLAVLVHREPVAYPPGTPVRTALEHMLRERIGSVVVIDPQSGRPLGIITASEAISRIALQHGELSLPVEQVMNTQMVLLSSDATAHDAVLAMARRGERYVMVLSARDGSLLGVLSRSDIHSAQRIASEAVVNGVLSARNTAELATAADDVRHFTHRLLRQGVAADQIIQWVSALNDILSLQVIDLMRARFELPDVDWCWLAFGAEGRFEQTFATDQDNGLVFDLPEGGDAEALRARFLPFAQAVCQALDECGFPLSRGQIMAGNAQWCLALPEWQSRFDGWMSAGDAKALHHTALCFDFRPLYGQRWLADALRERVMEQAVEKPRFAATLAKSALEAAPPLGLLRAFVLDRDKDFPKTIDLKAGGIRPYVDAARTFALAHSIAATGTVERLRAVAERVGMTHEDLQAAIEGFHFVQKLRLRKQLEARPGDVAANRINPYQLNQMDRYILKHALHQSKRLQGRMRTVFKV